MTFLNRKRDEAVKQTKRDWSPRLYGIYYCSPACGSKCKKVDYDNAKEAAETVAKTLGKAWKPELWENFGWHWRVTRGLVTVRPALEDNFFEAEICDRGSKGFLQFFGEGGSASAAIRHAQLQFELYMRECNASLARIQRLVLRLPDKE